MKTGRGEAAARKRALARPVMRHSLFEVVILAGGLSTRMGVDKSRLRLNGRSMLALIRATASELRYPVRSLRRDAVQRCGPLGGILTALKTTRARAVLFLACDMPLISSVLLKRVRRLSASGRHAVFTAEQNRIGFPLLLPTSALSAVESQIARRALSVHELADLLQARTFYVAVGSRDLFNVNTQEDKAEAERNLRQRSVSPENRRRHLSHFG